MFTRNASGWMKGEGQDVREHGNCGSGEVHAMRWWPVRRWRCWSGRDTDAASRQFWCHTHGTSHPRMLWTLQRHGQSRDMWTLQRHDQSRDMWTLQEKMRPIPNTRACTQSSPLLASHVTYRGFSSYSVGLPRQYKITETTIDAILVCN